MTNERYKGYTLNLSVALSLAALNLIIGSLVSFFKLPIYLDSIGIIVATLLLGWQYGIVCAIFTVGIGFFIINPYLPAYFATALGIILAIHFLRKLNLFSSYLKTVVAGLIIAIISAILSAPVTAYLFGGITLSGNDAITAYFVSIGNGILQSVIFSGLSSEPVDKVIVCLISYQILKSMPKSFIEHNNFKYYRD